MRVTFISRPRVTSCSSFSLLIGIAALAAASSAVAQTSADQTAQATPPSAPTADQSSVPEIVITAQKLNAARDNIQSNVGASAYTLDQQAIENLPQGENAPLNQVLLQMPGVNQDNQANGALHIRNEHLEVQYRINGVILPDGVSFFGQGLNPRFMQSLTLVDGAMPAEYGLRTAGVVDITTKSGVFQNGGSVDMYGGSYWTMQPSAEYAGNVGGYNYFVSGEFLHDNHGINSPVSNYNAVHDQTNQEHGFGYIEKIINPNSKVSAILGSFVGRFQIPNNPGQAPGEHRIGQRRFRVPMRLTRPSKRARISASSLISTARKIGRCRSRASRNTAPSSIRPIFSAISLSTASRNTRCGRIRRPASKQMPATTSIRSIRCGRAST